MVKSVTKRSKTAATNSLATPSPHGTAATAALLGPVLEHVSPHPPLPPQPSSVEPIRATRETLGHHQLDSTQFFSAYQSSQADLNNKVDKFTKRFEDKNNQVNQLLGKIDLICNCRFRPVGEEERLASVQASDSRGPIKIGQKPVGEAQGRNV
ncbi:unnamed protein product [Prunus armeniaca]